MTDRQPFIGARAYRAADARLFFGRSVEVRQARSLWLAQRVVVIHGPEASGKTSLLQAGLLPALEHADARILPVGRVGAEAWPGSAAPAASPADTLMRSWAPDAKSRLRGKSAIKDLLVRYAAAQSQAKPVPLLAAIDQFEQCLAPVVGRRAQDQLIGELVAALDAIPELRILLLIRQDFLPLLTEHRVFGETKPRYLAVPPFEPPVAAAALEKVAGISGISIASGAGDQFIRDLRSVTFRDAAGNSAALSRDKVEPLQFQLAGRSLWASLPPTARVITGEQLQTWGGVDAALIAFYNSTVSDAVADFGVDERYLRDWLQFTFVTDRGTRESVRDTQVNLSGIPAEVAGYLVEHRVLATEYRDGIVWYQLSHDRLAFAVQAAGDNRSAGQPPTAAGAGSPGTANGLRALAEAALSAGELAAARQHAAQAVATYQAVDDWRGTAATRVIEAEIARAAGDLISAERHLRSALSVFLMLEDGYSAARVLTALADVRFVLGDYAGAAELSRQAVERVPGDVAALTSLGYAQWQAGSPADAEATFGQVLRWESDAATALVGRGQIRADLGRNDSALDDLDRALQSRLGREIEADARSARALALAGLGRVAEARRELAASFQLDPDRPRSRLRAGRMAAILGERNEIRAEIERALSGRPSLSSAERESANLLLDSLR